MVEDPGQTGFRGPATRSRAKLPLPVRTASVLAEGLPAEQASFNGGPLAVAPRAPKKIQTRGVNACPDAPAGERLRAAPMCTTSLRSLARLCDSPHASPCRSPGYPQAPSFGKLPFDPDCLDHSDSRSSHDGDTLSPETPTSPRASTVRTQAGSHIRLVTRPSPCRPPTGPPCRISRPHLPLVSLYRSPAQEPAGGTATRAQVALFNAPLPLHRSTRSKPWLPLALKMLPRATCPWAFTPLPRQARPRPWDFSPTRPGCRLLAATPRGTALPLQPLSVVIAHLYSRTPP